MIDPGWAKVISDWVLFALGGVGGLGLGLWASLGRRDRALSAQITALGKHLDERLAPVETRITRIETVSHPTADSCARHGERLAALERANSLAPGHPELARAHERMDDFEREVGRMTGLLEGISHTVARIDQFMMEHGPRANGR